MVPIAGMMMMKMRGPSWVLCPFFGLWVLPFCFAEPPYKAVNLGGWLVTEGWMTPSLFDGIPNKDLLDGTQVQLQSAKLQKYVSSENGGGSPLVANRSSASGWETFTLWRINQSTFNLRVFNKQFVGIQGDGVSAISNEPGDSEAFQIARKDGDENRVRIRASNGQFLQAKSETSVTADYGGTGWGDDDPSVFNMKIVRTLRGEYQVTNGYGADKAPQVMQNHWDAYITDEDFKFMSKNGLNAVRIPVGWWIAYDPTPPKPFVGGSLQALDKAFLSAEKYGMKVIVDLHALKASQNGNDHSGTRDGSKEWGDSNIQETVAVIDFLTSRYYKSPALTAVELMNEPTAPDVTLENLRNYYRAGYNAVTKYTSTVYVILSNRLGPADPKEFLSFDGELVVIDVHYYNLFWDQFNSMTAQQNIDYINNKRSSDLAVITMSNGPLSFVGEWTAAWNVKGASKEEHQRFAKAQLEVYGRATFGWAYWSFRCDSNDWSIKWMIENGYITP